MVNAVCLGIESPGPEPGIEAAVRIKVLPGKSPRPIVLAPTLAGDVALKQIILQVTMIPALRNSIQPEFCVPVETRHLNIRCNLSSPFTHEPLIGAGRRQELVVGHAIVAVANRQTSEI